MGRMRRSWRDWPVERWGQAFGSRSGGYVASIECRIPGCGGSNAAPCTLSAVAPRAAQAWRGAAALPCPAWPGAGDDADQEQHRFLNVRDKVGDPENVFFEVTYPGKAPIKLAGHFWFNSDARNAGRKCPAIVELLPYRRRDGTMLADAKMYPWFAFNDYLCFRVDLQGSGDSEGVLTDEYTDEELAYCGQVIEQIAARADCSGSVGMMGKSWSAINSLMMAARPDRPAALKAVIVCAGSDDRWNDDVHYMGGGMMFDNVSWPSSMFGWLAAAPDPAVVGDAWKEMWRTRIDNADFWFKPWASNQPRDDVLERDSRARSLRRRRRAGVHPVGLAGRLQEPGAAGGRAGSPPKARTLPASSAPGATNIRSTAIPARASTGSITSSRIGGTAG